jgi:SWI/SNF-related matrix-associated actin-dependent regulator of chromatin subfamily A-like protein 1
MRDHFFPLSHLSILHSLYSSATLEHMERGIKVDQYGSVFVARARYEDKDIVKAAGFRWDPMKKQWWTADPAVAAKLDDTGALRAKIEAANVEKQQSIEASRQADADIELPVPDGLAYLPYQRAGIAYAMKRDRVMIADEMGLGKTIQAIGVINADTTIKRVLVICPASLRLNWRRELVKWLTRQFTVDVANGSFLPIHADIVICNYDICDRHQAALRSVNWDALIIDEAHYLKSPDAKRTVAILGKEGKPRKGEAGIPAIPCRRLMVLTGTPIPNRPVEAWTLVRALGVESNFFSFAKRYCAATQGRYGWDFSGASNLHELQDKLRAKAMVRRMKADVLTELPAKRRSVVELPANGCASAIKAEVTAYARNEETIQSLRIAVELAKASEDPEEYREAVRQLKEAAQTAFTELSRLRHDTAVAKVPYVVEHLRNVIDQDQKVVCFAHHKDVIEAIMAEFPNISVKITGDVAMTDRQAAVDRFQQDSGCKLFVGNIQAAGVGLTLTASSHVVFAELDWVPGNVSQAEDRCHRIGQRDSVLVEHLVLEGSLDARMATALIEKQVVIAAALDEVERAAPVLPTKDRAATESESRKSISEAAEKLTADEIFRIHNDLRRLASVCDGTLTEDGVGFNRCDTAIGRSLAARSNLTPRQAALGQKILRKYRRQLGY